MRQLIDGKKEVKRDRCGGAAKNRGAEIEV